jgi:hypothetical protein
MMLLNAGVRVVWAALALALSVPAEAGAWSFTDGFEQNNRASMWFFDGVGSHTGGFVLSANGANNGKWYVKLTANAGAWSAVGTVVRLPSHPSGSGYVTCDTGFHVNAITKTQVNVEVIDPKSWTYIALGTHTLNAYSGYQPLMVPGAWTFRAGRDVYVRVAIGAGGQARVDDVFMSCWF